MWLLNTNFMSLTVELICGFFALLIMTKVLGKTQITQLTPFDFISALVLGELVGNAIYDKDIGINYVLYAVTLWGILIYFIEMLTQKIKKTRSILEGNPSIIIRDGQIDTHEIKKNRLDINQLQNLLRSKDVFSVREVEYAILESNGSVSVLRKSKYETVKKQDMDIPPKSVNLPTTVISDGEIVYDNLSQTGYDRQWLINELKKQGVTDINKIFYAEWLEGESLFINRYN